MPVTVDLPVCSATSARQSAAERLAPLLALEAALESSWMPSLDLVRAGERHRVGRAAFDPLDSVGVPDELETPFVQATKAIERAGLASNAEAASARAHRADVLPMIAAWLSGASAPRDRSRAVARRAAVLVARSRLRSTATRLRAVLSLDAWKGRCCPCCGGHPEFAIAAASGRTLVCARCDVSWLAARTGCTGCGASKAPVVVQVTLPDDAGYRLVVCNACGMYIKEGPAVTGGFTLVERALTAHLDAAAEARGLRL